MTRHLLVDLDGTLLGSHDAPLRLEFITRSLLKFSREAGIVRAFRGLSAVRKAIEKGDSRDGTNAQRACAAFARALAMEPVQGAELLTRSVAEIFPLLERHFFKIAGAAEFIGWAREKGYELTLATNPVWPEEIVKTRVRWAGIDPAIFGHITHSERMRSCKPNVAYYHELLEQTGARAQDCLMIGNDRRKDMPATRAGIPVFIIGPEGGPAGTFEALRARLDTFGEIT